MKQLLINTNAIDVFTNYAQSNCIIYALVTKRAPYSLQITLADNSSQIVSISIEIIV